MFKLVAMHYKPVAPTMQSVTWRGRPRPIPITRFPTGFARAYWRTWGGHTSKLAKTQKLQTLEKAVNLDKDDPFAHLYLGIAMLKTGERERGRKEIEDGLRAIDDTLEYIAEDRVYGFYWDPGMEIRNEIRKSLAAKLNDAQLTMAGERIGRQFDEEIDIARRDQARRGGGGDSGSGGN